MTRQADEVRLRGGWRAAGFVLTALIGVAGCAKILGDFSVGPAEPAGTGGSNVIDAGRDSAPRDSAGPDACAEGALSCQGQAVLTCTNGTPRVTGTCPFLCAGAGSCVGFCAPGSTSCLGPKLLTCQANGTWNAGDPCSSSICVGGPLTDAGPAHCLGACVPGSKMCTAATTLGTCDSSGQFKDAPCTFVCTNNACSGVCTPDALSCNGNQPQKCAADGTWMPSGDPCPNVCLNGACTGMCSDGTTQCNGDTVQTCVNGAFVDSSSPCQFGCYAGACTSCTPGSVSCLGSVVETCQQDGGNGLAPCPFLCEDGGCAGECAPGTFRCGGASSLEVQSCNAQSKWVTNFTCTFQCVSTGTSAACEGTCTSGDHRCNPITDAPEVCGTMGSWVSNGSCPNGCIGAGVCAGPDGG